MDLPLIIIATNDIRLQLLKSLASPQTKIIIVTPFLQDVDMGGSRGVRTFLGQQIKSRAEIELLTTPPDLTKAKSGEFRRKYNLLRDYSLLGTSVFLNPKLHAKAFCFNNEDVRRITVLGSANLTSKGLYDNLELAFLSARDAVYHSVMANVRVFMRHQDTTPLDVWVTRNALAIKTATGGNP